MVFPNLDVIRIFEASLVAASQKYRVSFSFKITILQILLLASILQKTIIRMFMKSNIA